MISSRRNFLIGATASLVTAPAIVRAASLMPVKRMIEFEFSTLDVYTLDFANLLDHDAMMREFLRVMPVPSHWLTEKGQRLVA